VARSMTSMSESPLSRSNTIRLPSGGTGLVYMLGDTMAEQDFWLLDLGTMQSRALKPVEQFRGHADL